MRRLMRARAEEPASPIERLPQPNLAGRIYAVGDVHGRADLLKKLLDKIYAEAEKAPSDLPITLILMGDYVDRGEDSKAVLALCRRLRVEAPVDEVVLLRGNHEAALLTFLKDPSFGEHWLMWGGVETLASYGVPNPLERSRDRDFVALRDDLRREMGADAAMLAAQTVRYWRCGNIFFCHAAIDVDRKLEEQPDSALLWGDQRFLERGGPEGVVVVHGHTVTKEPDIGHNRIGVDTGAFLSGKLSAAVIDAQGYRFLST